MMNKVKVTLEKDLRKKLGIRQFPIMKGDIVKIIKGSRRGEGGKVASVDHRHSLIIIDGINIAKADGKEKSFPIQPEKIEITKLDLTMEERSGRIRELASMKNIVLNDQTLEEYSTKSEPEEPEVPMESEELKTEEMGIQENEVYDDQASEDSEAEEFPEKEAQDDGEDDESDEDEPDDETEGDEQK